MSQPNELTDKIARVLKLGGNYLSWASAERQLARAAAAEQDSGPESSILQKMLRVRGRRNEAKAELLKILPPLAVGLEAAGHDASRLLRFRHRINGGGGPQAAGEGWEELRVWLKRVQLTPTQPGGAVEPLAEAAEVSGTADDEAGQSFRGTSR